MYILLKKIIIIYFKNSLKSLYSIITYFCLRFIHMHKRNLKIGKHVYQMFFPDCSVVDGWFLYFSLFLSVFLMLLQLIIQFSSVTQLCLNLCDPMNRSQASLSITNSWSLLKLMSIESVMPSSHLILCRPLLLLPSILPSIRVFSNESTLCMRWPNSVQFSSVAQSCPTLCNPMNLSMAGLPVHHQLPELTQTHVHRVSDAI